MLYKALSSALRRFLARIRSQNCQSSRDTSTLLPGQSFSPAFFGKSLHFSLLYECCWPPQVQRRAPFFQPLLDGLVSMCTVRAGQGDASTLVFVELRALELQVAAKAAF